MRIKANGTVSKRHTDQRKREMLEEALEHGWTMTQAGKEFKVSREPIRTWCHKFDIVLERVRSSDCSHRGT
jgi:hypothetical protein